MTPTIKGLPVIAPKPEEVPLDGWNRATFRSAGIQGRRGAKRVKEKVRVVKGIDDDPNEKWQGFARRKFLGRDGRPNLYMSHAEGWLTRIVRRKAVSSGKLKRTLARMRARGEA